MSGLILRESKLNVREEMHKGRYPRMPSSEAGKEVLLGAVRREGLGAAESFAGQETTANEEWQCIPQPRSAALARVTGGRGMAILRQQRGVHFAHVTARGAEIMHVDPFGSVTSQGAARTERLIIGVGKNRQQCVWC